MKTFKVLSLLLMYPETDWLDALPEMEAALASEADANGDASARLAPLFALLRQSDLIRLQENYVATFDRNPSHSLHLFEHIHGESRDRGSAMVDLLQEYWKYDFDASAAELPDYVPLFLEFLRRTCAGGHRPQARCQRKPLCHHIPSTGIHFASGGAGTGRAAGARHGRGHGAIRPLDGWGRAAAQARSAGVGGADAGFAPAGGRCRNALITGGS